MKRWICLLLTLAFATGSLFSVPRVSAAGGKSWDRLLAIESLADETAAAQTVEGRAALYASRGEQMIQAVCTAEDYVPGSLERHGDFFFWRTTDGRANGYAPSFRARIRDKNADTVQAAAPGPVLPDANAVPDNRDVGVFIPYSGSYYFYPEQCIAEGEQIAQSTGGSLQVYTAPTATVDNLAKVISQCGFLLINSHGMTDYEMGSDHGTRANSSYICLPTDEGVTAADQVPVTGPYGTYYHAFYSGPSEDFDETYYCVDGTCIANHMQSKAPNSMIWLGFCCGMETEGMYAPLRQKGVEAMIGFSEAVVTDTDHGYRACLCQSLLEDKTVGEAAERMKQIVGCPDPHKEGKYAAYPIAVSSQDPYPGRAHLTDGQQVLSVWKLHPAHPIEATVEPAGSADVQIVRNKLYVTPHVGFTFSDWEITQGDVTAERQGDTLCFDLKSPCAVRLVMQARTPSCLQFCTGEGHLAADIQGYVGDIVTLPQPEGELACDRYVYHFLGWSTQQLAEDTAQLPALIKAGTKYKLTQPHTTFYAVYGYYAPDDGVSRGAFVLVDAPLTDWSGDYVLTYQSTRALRASPAITGPSIASASAVVTQDSAEYFIDGAFLNEVPEELVYTFLPDETGAGTFKMKTGSAMLCLPSNRVLLSTTEDASSAGAAWRMAFSNGALRITNARLKSYVLQYSPSAACFCALPTVSGPLDVYKRVPGRHLYTTSPESAPEVHTHIWSEPTYTWSEDNQTVTAQAVCTQDASHIVTQSVETTREETAATCLGHGEIRYLALFTQEPFQPQTRTVQTQPLGHSYRLSGWRWQTDASASAVFTCQRDAQHTLVLPAKLTVRETAPTCLAPGVRVSTAQVTLDGETWSDEKTTPLPALGHALVRHEGQDPTCTEPGWAAYDVCERCGLSTQSILPALGHVWRDTVTPPSCTSGGAAAHTCERCGETYEDAFTPPTGHTPAQSVQENRIEPTCAQPGGYDTVVTCAVCGAELSRSHTELAALGHAWDDGTVSEAPGCETPGRMEQRCARCGETRSRSLPAVGHTPSQPVEQARTEPDCETAGGYDLVTRCESCGKLLSSEHTELPALGHLPGEPVAEQTIPPTCTAAGSVHYLTRCTRCGAVCDSTIQTLAPLGHAWAEPVYTWSEDNTSCTASRVCQHDPAHVQTETAAALSSVTAQPTQDTPGAITYTAEFLDPAFATQSKTEPIPKTEPPAPTLPCNGDAHCPGAVFADLPPKGHWAHDPIDWAIVGGITAGTSKTSFSPDDGCTRAQVVTFLWRAAGKPSPKGSTMPFRDVPARAYYETAVLWAVEQGITAGTGQDTFSPDQTCTRAQIVTFLWRYAGSPNAQGANPFADLAPGAYYVPAVLWASSAGVTAGTTDATFTPGGTCTRAQIVTFLYRAEAQHRPS